MSNLVPDSSCLFCMMAYAVSEIFADWHARMTSSYSGCGWLHVMLLEGDSFGPESPLRTPMLVLGVRDDVRKL